jgi:hypothetical protein
VGGGIILQLAPTITRSRLAGLRRDELVFGIACVFVLLVRAIDLDSKVSRTSQVNPLNSQRDSGGSARSRRVVRCVSSGYAR